MNTMTYQPRIIEEKLGDYMAQFPVVSITGPRQSGKSTLLLERLPNYEYVTFDQLEINGFFSDDPVGFMQRYNNRVIFDEAQKAPDLFNAIKVAVDQDRQNYGKFILTGSSQFQLVASISESLAGRVGQLELLPYQFAELPKQFRKQAIYAGSYPELANMNYSHTADWYSAYLNTYITRDVKDIADIGNLQDFTRLIRLLAANASQLMNMSHYAKDIGVSVNTIKKWLSVLEASYIIFFLPPYHSNLGKRIVKSPKCYFYDTGLVSYLTGVSTEALYKNGPMAGALFENYIVADIVKREKHRKTHSQCYFYRTSNGDEVDLIIDHGMRKELIEIKSTATPKRSMFKVIESLLAADDMGYVLYNGKLLDYAEQLTAMPYQDYLLA